MSEMRAEFRRNTNTGKSDLVLTIDTDPTPSMHEHMHRRLVEMLIGQRVPPEDVGEIVVERGSP
jgi:hypothetical protein